MGDIAADYAAGTFLEDEPHSFDMRHTTRSNRVRIANAAQLSPKQREYILKLWSTSPDTFPADGLTTPQTDLDSILQRATELNLSDTNSAADTALLFLCSADFTARDAACLEALAASHASTKADWHLGRQTINYLLSRVNLESEADALKAHMPLDDAAAVDWWITRISSIERN